MELELGQLELKYEELRIREPAREARLLASLAEQGQHAVVLVVESEQAQRYVLIDGYRRVSALKRLGSDTVEALVLAMGEHEALLYCLQQDKKAKRSALEEGWLIAELIETHALSMDQVAARLERSKSWVSRRLALVKALPEPVQALVKKGRLCAYGAAKYLVPLARANRGQCILMAEGLGTSRLSTRQLGRLYLAWKRADTKERRRIAENPLLFLKALDEIDRAQASQDTIVKELGSLRVFCRRLCRQVGQGSLEVETAPELSRLKKGWIQTREAFHALTDLMEENFHAGDRHENSNLEAS